MRVACLWIPEFAIALARREDPRLRDHPVVISDTSLDRGSVAACSAEARARDVAPGMPLGQALARCAEGTFLPPNERMVAREAERLLALGRELSPRVEAIEAGHLHMEADGLPEMAGLSEEAWAGEVVESVSATMTLEARLGVASVLFAAHAGALTAPAREGRRSACVPRGEEAPFLAAMPVEVLPVEEAMVARLRLLGLRRLEQLTALPFGAMQAEFGPAGALAWRLARAEDDTPLRPTPETLDVAEAIDLPAPSASLEAITAGIRLLLERLLRRQEVGGRALRAISLTLTCENNDRPELAASFRRPSRDLDQLLLPVRSKLEAMRVPAAVEGLAVRVRELSSDYAMQHKLWPEGPSREPELLEAAAHLQARLRAPQLYRVVESEAESRIPERQFVLAPFGL